jgi:hypothetical protein
MAISKFDKLIEYVISDDQKKARALFHQIVVEKSRKIYEDLDVEPERVFDDVEADHISDEFGGDEGDDLETDVFADDDESMEGLDDDALEGEDELNPEIDDRVADLETEFDALKAEFEELLGDEGEEHEEESDDFEELADDEEGDEDVDDEIESEVEDQDFDDDEEGTDEDGAEDGDLDLDEDGTEEDEEEDDEPVDESVIREYVDKVTKGLANSTESEGTNKKSVVAGKNDIVKSVSAKNLNQGGKGEEGRPTPTSGKFTDEKIANVPGADSGVKSLKSVKKPTNKEGGEVNKKSVEA